MAGLFDKNGNATETHIATVSGFDPITGEHSATYEVRIFAGTGIPGFSTLSLAPEKESGYAYCWDGSSWQKVIDLRNSIAYEKSTGTQVTVKTIGPLDDSLTVIPPSTDYDTWNGSVWETDKDAQNAANVATAQLTHSALLTTANTEISWRQDAVDAEIATDEEVSDLAAWKKYRVLLMRVDTTNPIWPEMPE